MLNNRFFFKTSGKTVDDLAEAVLFLMNADDKTFASHAPEEWPILNAGGGREISIADLSRLVAESTRFRGKIEFDPSKPDGTPRKLLDSSRLNAMGWRPRIEFEEGIEQLCTWYGNQETGSIRDVPVMPVDPGNENGSG